MHGRLRWLRRWSLRVLKWGLIAALLLAVLPVVLLRFAPAYSSSFMLQYRVGDALDERERPALQHDWVGWEAISAHAKLAVIASEDQKFPAHYGFDFDSIQKAADSNRRGKPLRGASTISQQTAKNLFLWPGGGYFRKGLEAGYTLLIELLWPKRRILTVYLNVAEFGEGVYGIEAASRRYFRKPAAALTRREAALLAAVLPSPKRYRVDAPSPYVLQRAAWIEAQMGRLGAGVVPALER